MRNHEAGQSFDPNTSPYGYLRRLDARGNPIQPQAQIDAAPKTPDAPKATHIAHKYPYQPAPLASIHTKEPFRLEERRGSQLKLGLRLAGAIASAAILGSGVLWWATGKEDDHSLGLKGSPMNPDQTTCEWVNVRDYGSYHLMIRNTPLSADYKAKGLSKKELQELGVDTTQTQCAEPYYGVPYTDVTGEGVATFTVKKGDNYEDVGKWYRLAEADDEGRIIKKKDAYVSNTFVFPVSKASPTPTSKPDSRPSPTPGPIK